MVSFFSHHKQILTLSYLIASLISSAYAAPITAIKDTANLIKRGDFYMPPPTNLAGSVPNYRSHSSGQAQRPTVGQNLHSDRKGQRSQPPAQSNKSRWTGLGEMGKTTFKRTGSQQDLWWQGKKSEGDAGHNRRKKDEYNFHKAK